MDGRNAAGGFVSDEHLLDEEIESAKLVVAYYGMKYEILEFSSFMKFDYSLERSCRKCKQMTKGDYVQIADKVINIRNVDHDWIPAPELKEKIMESPTTIKRLNQLLRSREADEILRKFSRRGVCHNCLDKIDAHLGE